MSIFNLDTLLENQLEATGELDPQAPQTRLHFPSGQTVVIPTELLLNGSPQSKPAAEPLDHPTAASPVAAVETSDETVIPLVAEQLDVSKKVVETARLRLTREIEEFTQTVSVPLTNVTWEVERVAIGQPVAERPEVRQVGEVMIFPLLEERLVTRRELYLREEVHVRKVSTTVEKTADFTLKRDVLTQERTETPGA